MPLIKSLVAFVLLAAVNANTVAAQAAGVNFVTVSGSHELLGDPLVGVGASFDSPLHKGQLSFRFSGDRLWAHTNRTGVPCAGLIQPGTCGPEPVRDDARFTSVAGGAQLRAMNRWRVTVALTGDLVVASVGADTHGLTSGRVVGATKALWGALAGAELAWTPLARVPLSLEVGGAIGGLVPLAQERVVDGYTPFEEGFGVSRLRVGVAFRPLSR